MNKRLLPIIIAAFLLDGCAFFKNPNIIPVVSLIAETATTYAVNDDLHKNPGHRPAYEASVQALNLFLISEKYDSASLKLALSQLPIKEFRGPQGALIVASIVQVFQMALKPGETNTLYDIQTAPAVQAIGTAIRDGIETALTMNPVKPAAEAAKAAVPPVSQVLYYPITGKHRRI